jgi:hypothetical protein
VSLLSDSAQIEGPLVTVAADGESKIQILTERHSYLFEQYFYLFFVADNRTNKGEAPSTNLGGSVPIGQFWLLQCHLISQLIPANRL